MPINDIFDVEHRVRMLEVDSGTILDDDQRHDLAHHVAKVLGIPTDGTVRSGRHTIRGGSVKMEDDKPPFVDLSLGEGHRVTGYVWPVQP